MENYYREAVIEYQARVAREENENKLDILFKKVVESEHRLDEIKTMLWMDG